LIETSGSNADHDSEKLQAFLEDVMEKGIVVDGTLAQDETQIKSLWAWREGITESLSHLGGTYKYDVSIPLKELYQLVEDTKARVDAAGLLGDTDDHPVRAVVGYGHMGDANLHLNVSTRRFDERVEKVLEPFIYEWIAERQGSISAEHGLGLMKKKFIGYSRNPTMVGLMKNIKNTFDPVRLQLLLFRRSPSPGTFCSHNTTEGHPQPLQVSLIPPASILNIRVNICPGRRNARATHFSILYVHT
jgi:FAD/FMN-containing dehydrogenase